LVSLAGSYNQSGDQASAQATLQMALKLGAITGNRAIIESSLDFGFAVERMALGAMDPHAQIGENGQTVQDQLNRITQSKQVISQLDNETQPLMHNLTDQDWVNFTNRRLLFGEVAAMQWVKSKYGQ
jgi:hypothetical protein